MDKSLNADDDERKKSFSILSFLLHEQLKWDQVFTFFQVEWHMVVRVYGSQTVSLNFWFIFHAVNELSKFPRW